MTAPSKRAAAAGSDRAGRPPTVLLAEDEESFVDALVIGLGNEGFRVVAARDGQEALRMFEEHHPDLVLLDLMLPKVSGIDVLRTLRARTTVPIIMVTAKGAEIDTVVALEVGADDYVTKPYRLRELVARMRSAMRRAAQAADTGAADVVVEADDSRLEAGQVVMDLHQRRVFVRGEEVHLRRKEFELLRTLLENAGRVLTRDTLIDRVWGTDYVGDTKTLDVHVRRLRWWVEEDPANPRLITTVRGVGYRFDAPSSSRPPR